MDYILPAIHAAGGGGGGGIFGTPLTKLHVLTLLLLFMLHKLLKLLNSFRVMYNRKKSRPFPSIPYTVPHPHWLTGHLSHIGADVVNGQRYVCVDYASPDIGMSTFWTFHRPVISFLRADYVNTVLRYSFHREQMPMLAKHFKQFLGQHSLIMTSGTEWKVNRGMVHRAFIPNALQDAQRIMNEVALRFVTATLSTIDGSTKKELHIDAVRLCKMATLDIFGLAAMGKDFGCTAAGEGTDAAAAALRSSDIMDSFEFLTREVTRRCFENRLSLAAQNYWIPSPANLRHGRELRKIRFLLNDIIQEKRRTLNNDDNGKEETDERSNGTKSRRKGGDLLEHILNQASDPSQGGRIHSDDDGNDESIQLTDEYLSDFLITLLFGGFDTSSLSLAFALYILSLHPDAERKCYQEAIRVLGKHPNLPDGNTFHGTNDLPYCNAVLLEVLRLYPPVPVVVRDLGRPLPVEVNGEKVEVPVGSRVFVPIYWIHRYEKNFVRPDEFVPERWVRQKSDGSWTERTEDGPEERQQQQQKQKHCSEEDKEEYIPPANRSNLLAFSSGARSCVGQRFAMREGTVVLSLFVRACRAELVDREYEIKLVRTGTNANPEGGIPMIIRKREEEER